MQIKHLKSAISSLNQKNILLSKFLNKQKTNLADNVLSQLSKTGNAKLKKISSHLIYGSGGKEKIFSSDIGDLANYLKEQKGLKGLSISKYDLKQRLQKGAYTASRIDDQQKLAEQRDKQSQKLDRRNELFQRLGIGKYTKPKDSQSTNQPIGTPVKPSVVSSFWQTTKKQVLNNKKPSSFGLATTKPITTIASAGIKTPPKIPLAI